MQYLEPELAKLIVGRLTKTVVYNGGARCPLCGEWGIYDNRNIKVKGDIRRRYFRCPECGWKFRADECLGV